MWSGLEGVCEGMGGEEMGENIEGGEGEGFSTRGIFKGVESFQKHPYD